jgi:hypothetical protein
MHGLRSGGEFVLVDETAEDVASPDRATPADQEDGGLRRRQVKAGQGEGRGFESRRPLQKSSRSIAFGFTEGAELAVIQASGCVVAVDPCSQPPSDDAKGVIEQDLDRVLLGWRQLGASRLF